MFILFNVTMIYCCFKRVNANYPPGYQRYPSEDEADTASLNENIYVSKGYFLLLCSFINYTTAFSVAVAFFMQFLCMVLLTKFREPRDVYMFVYRLYGEVFAFIAVSAFRIC